MIEFICSDENCFNCLLPDCIRKSECTIKPEKILIDGNVIIRNGSKMHINKRTGKAKVTRTKKKVTYEDKPKSECVGTGKKLILHEDEKGKYYLRAGRDGVRYRQSAEAHERELQRQREYARKRYQLRKDQERNAV